MRKRNCRVTLRVETVEEIRKLAALEHRTGAIRPQHRREGACSCQAADTAQLRRRICVGSATMKKPILTLAALLLIGGSLMADSYRVPYSIRGSGRDVTVPAESSTEARRVVMETFPGAGRDRCQRDQVGSAVLN
jgi:hypothetical protein